MKTDNKSIVLGALFVLLIALIGVHALMQSRAAPITSAKLTHPLPTNLKVGPAKHIKTERISARIGNNSANTKPNGTGSLLYSSGFSTSPNWSGYFAQASTTFNEVKTTYVQPTVTCTAANTYTYFWVGLDGWSDNTVEQAGTIAYCWSATQPPTYWAWWEMYPTNSAQITSTTINPGDTINVDVSFSGGQYNLGVSDTTDSQSFSQVTTCGYIGGCQNSTAEWIVERPGQSLNNPFDFYPLANWGTINLASDQASVTGGSLQPIGNFPNYQLDMVDASGTTLDFTSALGLTGESFSTKFLTPNVNNPAQTNNNSAIVQRLNGETDLASVGPNNQLFFYYNAPDSPAWGRLTIDGPGSAFSRPVVIQRASTGETDVVVVGPSGTLSYYFNALGSPNWGKLVVADNGSASYDPSVIQRSNGETDIVVTSPANQVSYYFNAAGSPNWGRLNASGINSSFSSPAMMQRASGETDIVTTGSGNSLNYYFNALGSPNWGRLNVAGANSAYSAPTMLQRANTGETDIAVNGASGSLNYFFNALGSPNWGELSAGGSNTSFGRPVIMQRTATGETNIITRGSGNSLNYFFNAAGSPSWGRLTSANDNSSFADPSVIQRANGDTDIATVGPNHTLSYYFNTLGTPFWGELLIDSINTAY